MNSDLISRQALLEQFGLSEKTRKYGGDRSGYETMMLYEIQDVIESVPNVQSKTGKWTCGKDMPKDSNVSYYEGFLYCSNCKEEAYCDTDYGFIELPYCPYCGAKMEDNEEW